MNLIFLVCSMALWGNVYAAGFSSSHVTDSLDPQEEIKDLELILDRAEARASTEGRLILQTGRTMIGNRDVIRGNCWDYINGVYNRAGYSGKLRVNVFKSKKPGPYADVNDFQPGDWLYYVNHSYGDVEHSGVFVDWTDFSKREAVMLSYAGGNQAIPGRYRVYDLTHTFFLIRPKAP